MATNYAYYYAIIDLETGECLGVMDMSSYVSPDEYPEYIAIPEYNEDYMENYYNQADGNWYTDAEFTIPLVL